MCRSEDSLHGGDDGSHVVDGRVFVAAAALVARMVRELRAISTTLWSAPSCSVPVATTSSYAASASSMRPSCPSHSARQQRAASVSEWPGPRAGVTSAISSRTAVRRSGRPPASPRICRRSSLELGLGLDGAQTSSQPLPL